MEYLEAAIYKYSTLQLEHFGRYHQTLIRESPSIGKMKFTVPDDSDPPSTPPRSNVRDPIPSTTPVGPPPSASKSLYHHPGQSPNAVPGNLQSRLSSFKPSPKSTNSTRGRTFGFPSSPPADDVDDTMMDDENQDSLAGISPGIHDLRSSLISGMRGSQRSPKRQRLEPRKSISAPSVDVKSYARGIAASNPQVILHDSEALILRTEKALEGLNVEDADSTDLVLSQSIASSTATDLLRLWTTLFTVDRHDIESQDVGPAPDQIPAKSAFMLASLLIPIHHPNAWVSKSEKKGRYEQSVVLHGSSQRSIPDILLGWLAAFHEPGADVVNAVLQQQGCYYEAPEFWDGIMSSLIRGNLPRVMSILRGANFRKSSDSQFTNPQLEYMEEATNIMLDLLESCPAFQSNDWDVKGSSWAVFRNQVSRVKDELRGLLEGEDGEGENISRSQLSFSLSRASRQAESRLPQDVYDALNDMCDVMLGNADAIKNSAYDWVEAIMCLTIWWDGEDLDADQLSRSMQQSMSASTRSLRRSRQSRAVDVTPTLAYRQRLSESFQIVMDEPELVDFIDWNNPFHVALCCIFESEIEGFISLIRNYSVCISAAITEIGSIGGWLSGSDLRPKGFDEDDLMVLSYANDGPKPSLKDETLKTYAQLEDSQSGMMMEGWDLALSVLARIDDSRIASESATALLDTISLHSNARVDKILDICLQSGFTEQGTHIAEVS